MLPNGLNFQIINHSEQRYNTPGDYWIDDANVLQVRVSRMPTPVFSWLIFVHEIIECIACLFGGVSESDITTFDVQWEADYAAGLIEGDIHEPGEDPRSPYHREHVFAENIEWAFALLLGVRWVEYEAEVTAIWRTDGPF